MIGLFLAEGFEEIEALATVDIIRRAGIELVTISIGDDRTVTGSHNIPVIADTVISKVDIKSLDAVILPGGAPGFKNLEKCAALTDHLAFFADSSDKMLAAICGAPSILGHLGLLKGRTATIYPGMESELTGAVVKKDRVVIDKNLITSRGAGTAVDFALAIVGYLKDKNASDRLAEAIVYV